MPDDNFEIPAQPFKRFFIDVITRDLNYLDTIPEFVDNSIDGAIRNAEDDSLDDFEVRVTVEDSKVEVVDDCGGLPRELAENYAFRFGRPDEIPEDYSSVIGEFGIGMKRSIFKLGRYFLIESNPTDGSRFIIEQDVNEWLDEEEEGYDAWTFHGEEISDDHPEAKLEENGTRIIISDLTEDAQEKISQRLFESRVRDKLISDFQKFLNRGLGIVVNREPVSLVRQEIKQSGDIGTTYQNPTFYEGESEIDVDILAGVGESDPNAAGWYVYCNGRLVLEADKKEETGWTGDEIPRWHQQFNRFRGYVNLKSNDPGSLPWNTSKTDINSDSGVFRATKQEMIDAMRPIIDFLNTVRQEQRAMETDETPLEQAIESAELVRVDDVDQSEERQFVAPESEDVDRPRYTTIRYEREQGKVRALKEELGVNSASEVGRQTFEHYYRTRVEE